MSEGNEITSEPIRKVNPDQVEVVGETNPHSAYGPRFPKFKVATIGGVPGMVVGALTIPFVLLMMLFMGLLALVFALLMGRKVSKNVFIRKI